MKKFLLSNLSIKYKLVVGMVFILIVAMGLLSYLNIPKKVNIKHALVVDDNYESRILIKKMLKTYA
ncbi:membrane or secreted protein [Candidatus Magnetomorum sp. HK-1]|nr:membrane or secreted protein [Candidatus Magnetomorum sp. HK-1]